MTKFVIFDVDGTISDTIPNCVEIYRKAISPYVGHTLSYEEIAATFGLNEIGMIKTMLDTNIENAVEDYFRIYEEMHDNFPPPFEGIKELLAYLKTRGIKLAVVTGKAERSCQITLRKFGLQSYFDDAYYGDEKLKIKHKSISALLQKHNISSDECFYVGDTVTDVTESQKAGITCLSAAWSASADKSALEKANAGNVFERVSDLRKFFESVC